MSSLVFCHTKISLCISINVVITVAHFQYTLPSQALLHHRTSQTTRPGDSQVVSIYHTGQLYRKKNQHRDTMKTKHPNKAISKVA